VVEVEKEGLAPRGAKPRGGTADERREARTVYLASVQFITIVDFMIVMRWVAIDADDAMAGQFGLMFLYTFAAGIAGVAPSSIVDALLDARRSWCSMGL